MIMGEEERARFIEKLEAKGVERVRQELASGIYGDLRDTSSKVPFVKEWIASKERLNRKSITAGN